VNLCPDACPFGARRRLGSPTARRSSVLGDAFGQSSANRLSRANYLCHHEATSGILCGAIKSRSDKVTVQGLMIRLSPQGTQSTMAIPWCLPRRTPAAAPGSLARWNPGSHARVFNALGALRSKGRPPYPHRDGIRRKQFFNHTREPPPWTSSRRDRRWHLQSSTAPCDRFKETQRDSIYGPLLFHAGVCEREVRLLVRARAHKKTLPHFKSPCEPSYIRHYRIRTTLPFPLSSVIARRSTICECAGRQPTGSSRGCSDCIGTVFLIFHRRAVVVWVAAAISRPHST